MSPANKTKAEHYYSERQTSELRLKKISFQSRGKTIELFTGSGVFSGKKVDKGTEILIENMILKDNWDILDLGCGYGAVGISIKKSLPESKVFMVDVNSRAVKLARMNLKLNNLKATVKQGNLYSQFENRKFDTILVNPPQSAGKKTCIDIIKLAPKHLKGGGILQLVARHNKGGKHLSEIMEKIFGNIKTLVRKSGYRVYVGEMK